MGFNSVDAIANAVENGNWWQSAAYKSTIPFVSANVWCDGSVGIGTPNYQPYLGTSAAATPVIASDRSIYMGPKVPDGQQKYLLNWSFSGTSGLAALTHIVLLDVLLYYPFVNGDSIDFQSLDNTQSLPRYATGEGVYAMIQMQTPGTSTRTSCDLLYTNHKGVAGQVGKNSVVGSPTIGRIINLAGNSSSVTTTAFFCDMANGDLGIRSIQNIQFGASIGGYVCIALVKPIAQISIFEQSTFSERNFFREGGILPEIKNDAAINFIFSQSNGAGTMAPIVSFFETVWG